MRKIISNYKQNFKMHEITDANQMEIKQDNRKVLESIACAGLFMFVALFFVTLVLEPQRFLYIGFGIAGVTDYFLIKNLDKILKKIDLLVIQYTFLTVLFLVSISVGIITNTNNYSVVLPVFFALAPLLFIEKSMNTIIFFTTSYWISVILIFYCKGNTILAINDCINCTVFLLVGIMVKNAVTNSRLKIIQLNKILQQRENTDFLTKLPNRKKLFEKFQSSEMLHGIIMLDIDDFKKYNDTYGHQKGDDVLREIAVGLIEMTDDSLSFLRYGGEEFIGIFNKCSQSELTSICKELNKKVQNMNIEHSATKKGYVTISVGCYFSQKPIKDEKNIRYADIALYQAKANGKDNFVVYDETMEELSFSVNRTCGVR